MTRLDQLLQSIDPDRTLNETLARTDAALNTFVSRSVRVERWDDFKQCLSRFFCHVENTVLRINPARPVHPSMDWSRCLRILVKEYGAQGAQTGFEIARTGNEGGLHAMRRMIARRMAEDYAGAEVAARVNAYWRSLSSDEKIAAGWEYLEKYGHLLPSELTEGSAARVRAFLPSYLEKHPSMLQQVRRVGR